MSTPDEQHERVELQQFKFQDKVLMYVMFAMIAVSTGTALVFPPEILKWLLGGIWVLSTAYIFARLLSFPPRATIGADGLATESAPLHPRFVAWATVDEVFIQTHDEGSDICLRLKDETKIWLRRVFDADARLAACLRALEAFREREPVDVPASLLSETSPDAYRGGAVPTPTLVRVTEDPTLDAEIRLRAAKLAVAAGGQTSLDAVTEVMADRKMRESLEALRE